MTSRLGFMKRRTAAIAAAAALTATGALVATGAAPSIVSAQATGSVASAVVTVEPTRVLDTRSGTGLPAKISANTNNLLKITGPVATRQGDDDVTATVVPDGATGVLLNVTALRPSADGFMSIRPGDASGEPRASNLNFTAGSVFPNAVTVALPASGSIDIWYGTGTAGATTGVLVDVVGYTTAAATGGERGPVGPTGPQGEQGDTGPQGPIGPDGADGDELYQRTFVAHDDASFDAAVSAAAALSPTESAKAMIHLEPGTYESPQTLPAFVDLRGSGDGSVVTNTVVLTNGDISHIRFAADPGTSPRQVRLNGSATVRNITVEGEVYLNSLDASLDLTIIDSHLDTTTSVAVSASSGADRLAIHSSYISADPDETGTSGNAVRAASTTEIRDSELRGGNGAISGFGDGDQIDIIGSSVIGRDNTVAISSGARTVTMMIRDSYVETQGTAQIQAAPNGTVFLYNSTLAGSTEAGVNAPNETCVGVAEVDLVDGSANSWHDTTCP